MDPADGRLDTLEQTKIGGTKSLRSSSLSPKWTTAFLLTPPLVWFLVLYVSSLILMLITSLWSINSFTATITHQVTSSNFQQISSGAYPTIIERTVLLAALVTITDAIIAVPFAYVMARMATQRIQRLLLIAVLLPLWASYLAKIFAWVSILQKGGLLNWGFQHLGLPAPNLGFSNGAMWVTFTYIWLPFMIVPLFGAFERIPETLLEASSDLGASTWWTLRHIIVPLVLPGLLAGSIFTFSLTLGDYVTPLLVGGTNSTLIGNAIYDNLITGGNLPLAAALATVPIAIMVVYLLIAKRLGAFEAL